VADLILASTSLYRAQLLERLRLPFQAVRPDIDESSLPDETPAALTERLAEHKARAVAPRFDNALIIGSDQVAVLGGDVLGKPGNRDAARGQLRRLSGRSVEFLTSLCVLETATGSHMVEHVVTPVLLRNLDVAEIDAYVDVEKPFDCAGSFKSEGLGIALFESIGGDDPNALIGLPLIRLCHMLRYFGLDPLRAR
jgi:septum formation protein